MHTIWIKRFGAIAAALWLARPAQIEGRENRKTEREESDDSMTRSLNQRLRGNANLDDVMVDIRWYFDDKYASCRVFGNGVGIWDRSVQFRLPRPEAWALIKKVARARFGSLPDSAGNEEGRSLKGRIVVLVGGVRKTVSQFDDGEQSQLLQELAESFMRASKTAASVGVRVSSFQHGFEALASGKLAPEALELFIQRKVLLPGGEARDNWQIRIYGRRLLDRVIGAPGNHSTTRELSLSASEFDALVHLLAAGNLATLPLNLYSIFYTDLDVSLLDQHKNIQAREFTGLSPQTHGKKQQAFDGVLDGLVALHKRARKQGRTVAATELARSSAGDREREEGQREKEAEKP